MQTLLSVFAAAVCLGLPGLAVMVWLARPGQPVWEFVAEVAASSLALTSLCALFFFVIGVAPGGWGAGVYLGLCVVSVAAAWLRNGMPRLERADRLPLLLGTVAFAGLLALRFSQSSGLALPNWVDSVHHSLIVRKIIEYGGLPLDLTPYLNVPLSYHYGFHISTALFAFLSGLPSDQAVLWFGQVINALVSLSIYRLGRAVGLDRRAAFLAALLSGFVLYMPGYYLSWGRYTLLSGLILLPIAMAAVLDLKRQPGDWKGRARLVFWTAGLCLTHYLALLLFLFFLALFALEEAAAAWRSRDPRKLPWETAAACLLGALLASPWLVRMLVENAASIQIGEPKLTLGPGDFGGLLSLLRPEYDLMLMEVAAVCLLLAFFKPMLRKLAFWGVILLFFSMPFAPKPGPFRADLFIIVLFVPASLFLGWGMVSGADTLAYVFLYKKLPEAAPRLAWLSAGLLALSAAGLLILGVSQTRQLINPSTRIADEADRAALVWVQANTPADARFYINSALWMTNTYRGVDGGYWLPSLTGRGALVPPVFYTMLPSAQMAQVNDWAARSLKLKSCSPDFWEIVRQADLTYVYVRQGRGNLQPGDLDQCPRLEPLYRQDGVVIYKILTP